MLPWLLCYYAPEVRREAICNRYGAEVTRTRSTTWITPEPWKVGIDEISSGVYAYIQPYGELGVSNALIYRSSEEV